MNNTNTKETIKKAIYAGSFDPFHNGHLDIVKKASKIFDEVYIIIAINKKKNRYYDIKDMIIAIENTLKEENLNNCFVLYYEGLIAKFCQENNIYYTIRGLRDSLDFSYEENIAKTNNLIFPNLETIYLRANNSAISSSMVKELIFYKSDVVQLVPKEIYILLSKYHSL